MRTCICVSACWWGRGGGLAHTVTLSCFGMLFILFQSHSFLFLQAPDTHWELLPPLPGPAGPGDLADLCFLGQVGRGWGQRPGRRWHSAWLLLWDEGAGGAAGVRTCVHVFIRTCVHARVGGWGRRWLCCIYGHTLLLLHGVYPIRITFDPGLAGARAELGPPVSAARPSWPRGPRRVHA